ncbi:hypothetical protein [Yersinia bercovieri]|nr:hypothetical protein [Yersinia bercovieri]MDN0103398.1 hypothetical protein [Yersinia bercovieri]
MLDDAAPGDIILIGQVDRLSRPDEFTLAMLKAINGMLNSVVNLAS